jgi:hypothetical protein
MRVKFVNEWFGPTDVRAPNEMQSISGQRFRKGVHTVPEALRKYLPKSAVIIDKEESDIPKHVTMADMDVERASGDAFAKAEAVAEKRRQALQKAREAKAAKAQE